MTEKVPEKIYFTKSRRAIEYIKWAGLDKKDPGDNIEYIRADLVEPIVEIYEKYTGSHKDIVEKAVLTILEFDLWQAIKTTVKQLVEK